MQTSTKVSLERLRKHVHPEPLQVVGSNLLLGASLSGVDSLFAVSIQLMALSIGAAQDSQSLPDWVPRLSLNASLAVMTGTLFLRALVVWSQGFFKDRLGENFRALRRRLMTEVSFESREINVGDTLNLFNTFTFSAGDWIVRALVFVQGVGSILGLFAVLLYHSPMLFLAGNVLILVLSPFYLILNRRIRNVSVSNKNSWQKIVRFLTAQMRNLTFLRISGTSELEARRLESQLEGYRIESIRLRALKAVSFPLIQLFGGLALCGLIFVAQSLGSLQSAALLGFVYLFSRYVTSAANCLASYSDCVLLFPYFQHLLDASDIAGVPEHKGAALATPKLLTNASPAWEIKSLDFSYPKQPAPVFTKLDLTIEPGTWVALIGNSGAGKSTLIQLLLGQLQATNGEVTLNWGGLAMGVQARSAELLRACGYVGAEGYFLEGSLRENLFYGLEELPSESSVARALELACCDFVSKLPGGLEYRLSDFGEGLSVGEKQRLALARALLREPKLLILDETMSFWDEDLELKIAANLKSLSPQPTIISAGHRSDAIARYADRFYNVGDKTLTELKRSS
jgi:ABC-type multidrug transport system fused ATPase/permease subunit